MKVTEISPVPLLCCSLLWQVEMGTEGAARSHKSRQENVANSIVSLFGWIWNSSLMEVVERDVMNRRFQSERRRELGAGAGGDAVDICRQQPNDFSCCVNHLL